MMDRGFSCVASASQRSHIPFPVRPLVGQIVARATVVRRQCRQQINCTAVVEAPAAETQTQGGGMGPDLWNFTYYPKLIDTKKENKPWYIIDAEGQTLGRLATLAADHIRGKTLAAYSPSMNMGGYVVVINADKVVVTGRKTDQKMYRRHSGRPGGLKEETFRQLQKRIPERIVEKAVRGMLPTGRIGNTLFNQLKVVKGPGHPHSAQKPVDITFKISKKPQDALTPP